MAELFIRRKIFLKSERQFKKPKPGKKRLAKWPKKLLPLYHDRVWCCRVPIWHNCAQQLKSACSLASTTCKQVADCFQFIVTAAIPDAGSQAFADLPALLLKPAELTCQPITASKRLHKCDYSAAFGWLSAAAVALPKQASQIQNAAATLTCSRIPQALPSLLSCCMPVQTLSTEHFYIWQQDRPASPYLWLLSVLFAVIVLLACLFPLAPHPVKLAVVYTSMFLLSVILGVVALRAGVAGVTWILLGRSLWIFPNMLQDVRPPSPRAHLHGADPMPVAQMASASASGIYALRPEGCTLMERHTEAKLWA